ncbi:LpqB family beta-propeller domain-containing protein [Tenggerimyces flavus]|uniref:LpqB family beta-propeller domain-containing protein n=1 Tax=Tenggerimyces flavus TaxID=1708749 RepID=A0ABV7YR16_9ACTN|nr:LpqB family beta-propeller domain-containing protein [Tenggerimyces flavus]MBM7786207.1 hypothetical protein [Tenggerimyces flavus]
MRRLLVGLVAVVALTGCAALPMDREVRSAPVDLQQGDDELIPAAPEGPRAGDTPEQILEGFLAAMATYQRDFPVAREFLVPSERALWRPTDLRVHESSVPRPFDAKTNSLRMQTGWIGTVGADGGWTPAARDAQVGYDFKFVQAGKEWRIANPPNFLLISDASFKAEYLRYDTYFWDSSDDYLVPDPVYLPFRGNVVTMLVQAVLDGPTAWMKPAVRTAIPRGTRLTTQSVPVVDDQASIDLDGIPPDLSYNERRLIANQLSWTLRQVPDLKQLQLLSQHEPLQVVKDQPGSSVQALDAASNDRAEDGTFSTNAYALRDGRVVQVTAISTAPALGRLGNGQVQVGSMAVSPVPVSFTPAGGQDTAYADRYVVVSPNGREVLLVNPRLDKEAKSPTSALNYNAPPELIYTGQRVLEPSWDREGLAWLVDRRSDGTRIVALDPIQGKGKPMVVKAPALLTRGLQAFKVSRDGIRIAALVRIDGHNRLMMGWISRTGTPQIGGIRELPLDLTDLSDLAWSSVDQVAVLGRDATGVPAVGRVSMDGRLVETTPPPGTAEPKSIAAAPGLPLLMGATDGSLYREDREVRWVLVDRGASPVYPG